MLLFQRPGQPPVFPEMRQVLVCELLEIGMLPVASISFEQRYRFLVQGGLKGFKSVIEFGTAQRFQIVQQLLAGAVERDRI